MKKNRLHVLGLMALTLATTLLLSGCNLAAKNLAKQTQNAVKQMADLQKKAGDIEEKAAALSARNRRTYQEELARLGVADAPDWLYSDEAALFSGAPEETEDEAGDILAGLARMIGSGGGSSGSSVGAEAKPSSLPANKWVNGNAVGDGSWYSFNATKGRTYHVFWNDEDNSGGTADVKVAAYYRDGSEIFDVDNSSSNSESFTASAGGAVKIKVYPYSSRDTGTFSVAYSTNGTRPSSGSAASSGGSSSGGGLGGLLSGIFGGGRSDSALNGTWVPDDSDEGTMTFRNGNWELSMEGGPFVRGTLTTSGGNFSLTVTQVNGGHSQVSELREYGLESKWYTKDQFRAVFGSVGTIPDSVLNSAFFTTTGTYSVSGNKLTMTMDNGKPSTLTKRR